MKAAEDQGRLPAMLFIGVALMSLGAPQVYYLSTSATLLLTHHSADAIAIVYLIAAALMLPLGWVIRILEKMFGPTDVLLGSIVFRVLAAFALYTATVRYGADQMAYALAIWARLDLLIGVIALWRLAARIFNTQKNRRWLGWIGACDPVSTLIAGIAAPFAVHFLGVEAMIIAAGLLIAAAAPPIWLLRAELTELRTTQRPRFARAGLNAGDRRLSPALRNYVLIVAVAMTLWTMAHYLLDALFYGLVDARYDDPMDIFGVFSATMALSGVLGIGLVWVNEARLVRRFGPRLLLVIAPAVMLTLLGLGVFGASALNLPIALFLGVATMKVIEFALVSGFYTRSWRSLFAPMPETHRRKLIAGVEVSVHGVGAAFAAIVFVFLTRSMNFTGVEVAVVFAGLAGVGVLLSFVVQRGYDEALERALLRRQTFDTVEISASGRKSREVVQRMLRQGDKSDVIEAARLQAALDVEGFVNIAPRLIARGDRDVVKTLLTTVREIARPELYPPMAGRLIVEEDLDLRDRLLTAAAATGHPRSPRLLARALAESPENPPMGALVGLGRHGGPYGASVAGQFLERYSLTSEAALHKALEATIEIGEGAPAGPVALGLRSPDPVLRRKAIRAAGKIADPSLAPLLVEQLADPHEWRAATLALSAIGPGAIEPLARTIGDRESPTAQRIAAIRALGGIDDPEAREQLYLHSEARDRRLRPHAHLALWRSGVVAPREKAATMLKLAEEEIADAAEIVLAETDVAVLENPMLNDSLRQRARRSGVCAIRAAGLIKSRPLRLESRLSALFGLSRDWRNGQEGAYLLPDGIRTIFEAVANPATPGAVDVLRTHADSPTRPPEDWLGHILTDARWTTDWLRALAFHLLAQMMPEDRGRLEELATNPGPLLEKTINEIRRKSEGDEEMALSTVERVLILKSADLFANVPDEDLAEIAPFLTPVYLDPGETIITEGDMGDELYIVVTGEVAVMKGEEEIARRGERAVFGDLAALDPEPRSASVVALQPTQVLALSNDHLLALFEANVEIASGVISTLIRRLRSTGGY